MAHKQGCLRPDLASIEPDVTDNDPSTMPESVKKYRSFSKLEIFFQQDCVNTEDEADVCLNIFVFLSVISLLHTYSNSNALWLGETLNHAFW